MYQEGQFEKLHQQFEPMIFSVIKRLSIYKNESEFYQVGLIALWEASQRFQKEKGEFKSFAYSYIIGRMKTALTQERKKEDHETEFDDQVKDQAASSDDFSALLSDDEIQDLSTILTMNQSKWLKAYCLEGKTPSEIAHDEGVSVAAVKAWRRDALGKVRKHYMEA
ncbi:sigma-70 family RNA polymerase sigma factor [Bacillus weihaiensis]|uniref:RNA polymerase sigma-70 region 2 domain-containing protein n=1 Tax=Bacillus weihaiensis TaxID=1547283 RepID=A0A1L3MME6_9BACI|nr:sigma-70 family RNA polymerase sigma factor [Bacillus weihaiensis]APH03491.1 hypothetical protein A9C19_01250 [Bacillus weihaiensis]